jgi:hypothetical protein
LVGIQVDQDRLLDCEPLVGRNVNMEERILETTKGRRRPKAENLHWQPGAAAFQLEAHDVFPDPGALCGWGQRRAADARINQHHAGREVKVTEQVITAGPNLQAERRSRAVQLDAAQECAVHAAARRPHDDHRKAGGVGIEAESLGYVRRWRHGPREVERLQSVPRLDEVTIAQNGPGPD